MESVLRDIRHALRLLIRSPWFSAAAIMTLALGIGSSSATFSIVNSLLLNPISCNEPQQLMSIDNALLSGRGDLSSDREILDWKDQLQTFSDIAAYSIHSGGLNLTTIRGEPERIEGAEVSANFFSVFQISAFSGRTFIPEQQQSGRNRVTVLSNGLWQRSFGSDPNIVGQKVLLNGVPFIIIGVAPEEFRFPTKTELWIPVSLGKDRIFTGSAVVYAIVGRLKPDVTISQARADLDVLKQRSKIDMPGSWFARRDVRINPLLDKLVGNVRLSLLVLSGAVGFVLLIACANVSNLLLARAFTRNKEMVIRAILGANNWSLIRRILIESIMLAFVGGGIGLIGAHWFLRFLINTGPDSLARLGENGLDHQMIAFTLVVCLLTGVLAGLAPIHRALKIDLNTSLKEGASSLTAAVGYSRVKNALVVSEIALALVLLIGAGLLIKSLNKLQQVAPGFNPSDVMTMSVSLPLIKYPSHAQRIAFYQHLIDRIKGIPGVRSVGAISNLPFDQGDTIGLLFEIPGRPPEGKFEDLFAINLLATPDYFQAMGVPLLQGRPFTEQDTPGAQPVVIINQYFASRYWPDDSPVGKQLKIAGESTPRQIVGIVGDVKHFGLESKTLQEMYIPYLQTSPSVATIVVRTDSDPLRLVSTIKAQIRELDANLPLYDIKKMERWLDQSMAQRRFIAFVLSLFATVALVLAVGGIYSIMAYSVSLRTREIGIRLALGARRSQVLRLILKNGLIITLKGILIGLGGAIILTRVMSGLLYDLQTTDTLTFAVTVLGLMGVALLASILPAYRATRVDPIKALRQE